MKKKIFTMVISGLIIICSISYAAAPLPGISEFPVKIFFNNVEKKLGQEYTLLNFKGHAYAPVRFMAESMGARVAYHADDRSIDIQYVEPAESLSNRGTIYREDMFTLALYATDSTYAKSTPIRIWSTFTYEGPDETTIEHGDPLLRFYIRDSDNHYYEDASLNVLKSSRLTANSQILTNLTPTTFINAYLSKTGDRETPDAGLHLTPGTYSIGVVAKFQVDGQQKIYTTETEIVITP